MRRAVVAALLLTLAGCARSAVGVAARLEPERPAGAHRLVSARVEAVDPSTLPAPLRRALAGSALTPLAVTLHALDPTPLRLARPTSITLEPPDGAPRPLLAPEEALAQLLAEAKLEGRPAPDATALAQALVTLAQPLEEPLPPGEARRAIRLVELGRARLPGLGLAVTVLQDDGRPLVLVSRLSPP